MDHLLSREFTPIFRVGCVNCHVFRCGRIFFDAPYQLHIVRLFQVMLMLC